MNRLNSLALFVLLFVCLIGLKMIISSFKMPDKYYANKKTETVVLRKVLRTKQLDDFEKEQKIRDIFNGS